MKRFRPPPQIVRLILLTLGIVSTYAIARALLTPVSFHEYGFYRGVALEEIASRQPKFAGRKACDECHEDISTQLLKFEHKTISCESCHGIGRAHVDNPDEKILKPGDALCLRCHSFDPARPKFLKQIELEKHYRGQKCVECHIPHQPNEVP